VAVVSRFIPGDDLGEVVDRCRELSDEDQLSLRDALVPDATEDCASRFEPVTTLDTGTAT
jgi:hypothetical protein